MNENDVKKQLPGVWGNRFVLPVAVGTAVLGLVLGGSTAHATGFTLGDAANYGVLFEGAGGNQLSINNPSGLGANNGNIGIDLTGVLGLNGPLVINGNVDFANAVN